MSDEDERDQTSAEAEGQGLHVDDWQDRYETGRTGWDRGACSPALTRWLEQGELKPCRVLVPGCGRGHEVVELATRGFDVTAVDFASAAINEVKRTLREANLTAKVHQEDMLSYSSPQKFDAIYEQTSLCAISPKNWPLYENRLAKLLAPNGQLFALFMQTGTPAGPPFNCSLSKMQQLFDTSRWAWPETSFIVDHPAGLKEVAVVVRRSPTDGSKENQ